MKILRFVICFVFLLTGFRMFVGETCLVNSGSMAPTILPTEYFFYSKMAYGALMPRRWADIPVVNVFTRIPALREADEKNHWKPGRMPGMDNPHAGDIIVLESPEDKYVLLVKRIQHILYKGTSIPYNEKNRALIHEIAAKDGHRAEGNATTLFVDDKPMMAYVTERDYYYVMGDNRDNSWDSRAFGYVSGEQIVGKLCLRIFSVGREGVRWKRWWNRIS